MEGNFKWVPHFSKTGKRWARVITEYDVTKKNVFRFVGDKWLKQNAMYTLPVNSLVLAYDENDTQDQLYVRLYRVGKEYVDQRCIYGYTIQINKSLHWMKANDGAGTIEAGICRCIKETWGSYKYSEVKPDETPAPAPEPNSIITYDEVKVMGTKMIEFIQSSKNKDEATKTAMLLYVLYNSAKNARESRQ